MLSDKISYQTSSTNNRNKTSLKLKIHSSIYYRLILLTFQKYFDIFHEYYIMTSSLEIEQLKTHNKFPLS